MNSNSTRCRISPVSAGNQRDWGDQIPVILDALQLAYVLGVSERYIRELDREGVLPRLKMPCAEGSQGQKAPVRYILEEVIGALKNLPGSRPGRLRREPRVSRKPAAVTEWIK